MEDPVPRGLKRTRKALMQSKRVKGSETLWSLPGVEETLQVVTHLISHDGVWDRFWDARPLPSSA